MSSTRPLSLPFSLTALAVLCACATISAQQIKNAIPDVARLFLSYTRKVTALSVEPQGAIVINEDRPTRTGWKTYTVRGKTWGRARLTVTYDDNSKQSISYYVIKPESQTVADLVHF